jgi:accessory colonization factor AcfC
MKHKKGVLNIKLTKKGNKLIHHNESDGTLYKIFLDSLAEGQSVDVFFDAHVDNGTYAQISKLKVSIRELASESGHSFEEMQNIVKSNAGLCWEDYCKSFGDCSIEELALAIQATIEIGDALSINLRQIFQEK